MKMMHKILTKISTKGKKRDLEILSLSTKWNHDCRPRRTQYCYPNKNLSYFHLKKHRIISVPSDLSGGRRTSLSSRGTQSPLTFHHPHDILKLHARDQFIVDSHKNFFNRKSKRQKNLKQLEAEKSISKQDNQPRFQNPEAKQKYFGLQRK